MTNDVTQQPAGDDFETWAVIELMGRRRLAGLVREVVIAGAGLLRIDVPAAVDTEPPTTQFYSPSALYCLTPVSEASARAVARRLQPQPVYPYELPAPPAYVGPLPFDPSDRRYDDEQGFEDDHHDEIGLP